MLGKKEIGHTGELLSPLGLGTYNIRNYKNALNAFLYAVENGVELIDTAEMYGTEDFVGEVIKKVGRERLFIVTKIWPDKLYSEEMIRKAAENSLKKLGVRNVDLMLIHWPNRDISIERQVKNFEIVCKKGYARYMGVSNFNSRDLEEALSSTSYNIQVNEIKMSVMDKKNYFDVSKIIDERKISVLAYTPIERGIVNGNNIINEISKKYGRTPVQIALNYLVSKNSVFPIPKTESIEHMKEILESLDFQMNEKDIGILDSL